MASSSVELFTDTFEVRELNPGEKKFDRVDRLVCNGETYDVLLKIDVNCEVYPVKRGEKLTVAVVSTLRLDGKPDDGTYQHNEGERSLLDLYEYGMHGRVFKYDYDEDHKVSVYASFGGLLMLLHGEQRHLASISQDQRIYVLMRKTGASEKK